MSTYKDYLTPDFLRKYYVTRKMTVKEIHEYFLEKYSVNIHPNIITMYGNKVDVSDRSRTRWR